MVKKVTRKDYDMFSWIPIEQWSVDKLMGPHLGNLICCKICDAYVARVDSVAHIDKHIAQRKRQIAADKKEAKKRRAERLKLARESKKNSVIEERKK